MRGINWPQLIIVAVFVAFTIGGHLVNILRKQAGQRRAAQGRERRELEALRTGRPTDEPGPSPDEQRRQREIQTRREAELAELRRRMGGSGGEEPADSEGVLIRIPGSGPIVVRRMPPAPGPTPTPPTRSGSPPATVRMSRPQRVKRGSRAARPPAHATPRPAPAEAAARTPELPDAEGTQRTTTDEAPVHAVPAPPPFRFDPRGLTVNDWRRAFIMREILGTPPGLRGPGDPTPG